MTDNQDVNHLLGIDMDRQKRASALFLLKLKETHRLSQTALDDVVEGCKLVFSHTLERLHSGIQDNLARLDIDDTLLDHVFDEVADPFTGLETKYSQEKFIAEEFNFIVSTVQHGIVDYFCGYNICAYTYVLSDRWLHSIQSKIVIKYLCS